MFSYASFPTYLLLPGLLVLATPLLLRLRSSSSSAPSTTSAMAPPSKPHTLVVLGAGYIGVPLVHHLLKHTPASIDLRVILVSPNDAFYWNAASVRGILPSKGGQGPGFGDDKLFFDLAPAFAASAKSGVLSAPTAFEHVLGRATHLDPDARTIEVGLSGGGTRLLHYDTAVIATGSDMHGPAPFKTLASGGTAETRAALADLRTRIPKAQHVVVAGGGETGVEAAGELGHVYGRDSTKEIVLIVADSLPLGPTVKDSVRQAAAAGLERLGVRVHYNTRVASTRTVDGQTELTLTTSGAAKSSSTLLADVYLPALGAIANTEFLPASLVDDSSAGRRRVRTRDTLQVQGYDDLFVVGDVANLQPEGIKNGDDQLHVLAPQLQIRLRNWATGAKEPLRTYKPSQMVMFVTAMGPAAGTGQIGPVRIFSFLAAMLKARTLGTQHALDYAEGRRTLMDSKW